MSKKLIGSGSGFSDADKTMRGAVQIVALRGGLMGNLTSAWTGSGTIVHPSGIIVTNCHVANPRALGMSAPAIDRLAIAVTQRSDEPPAITYFAKVIAQSPQLDLAVLQIVAGLDGRAVGQLNLPYVLLGDSDKVQLGDSIRIFGYPGIGGDTVTFTSGSVSGFSHEEGIRERRAWIKTDATIAGGNSGGTAVDRNGYLVGIPTQAAAGSGITPVDARPVVDTNRDGRIDERDTPMAIGGFINGLRPINLIRPLLEQAGVQLPAAPAQTSSSTAGSTSGGSKPKLKSSLKRPSGDESRGGKQPLAPHAPGGVSITPAVVSTGPVFTDLVFSSQVTRDGRPIQATDILPEGIKELYAGFEFDNMKNGLTWQQTWVLNGTPIATDTQRWNEGEQGRKTLALNNPQGFQSGEYHLALTIEGRVVAEGRVIIGRQVDDTDSEISGQIVDEQTGRGISGATVAVLKPNVSAQKYAQNQNPQYILTSTQTDRQGNFTLPVQLPKGQAYSMIVVAQGYRGLAIEGALRIGRDAPEKAQLNPIGLPRG
ncbi:MAG: trypsin-like peptidase domain-containing protein [Anaerolineae bacterium]|jgi:hypothetical protein|nr:trypsin-like peptidase domain-containing protein [Anaerolineae bacterium]